MVARKAHVLNNKMNSIKKGNITEIKVQLELVKRGYHVFTPITDGCDVDLIFNKNGKACKVQVKKSKSTATGFSFEARKSTSSSRVRKKRYSRDEIDFFATIFNDQLYLVPIEDVGNRANVLLRLNTEYKNQNKPLIADNYLI